MTGNRTRNPASELADLDVRLERVIWLPGVGTDAASEDFKDFVNDDLPDEDDAPLYRALPHLLQAVKAYDEYGGIPEPEELYVEHLLQTPGFLLQAATPFRHYVTEKAWRSSWGHYRICWLYAPSETEILPVVRAWAESQIAEMKAKTLNEGDAPGGGAP